MYEWALDESVDFQGDGAWNFDEIIAAGEKLAAAAEVGKAGAADVRNVDFVATASPLLHAVKGRISSAFRS